MGDFRYVNSIEIRAYGSQQQRAAQVLPSGAFGSYLTSLPIARKIGATVFVHGGIHPGWAAVGIEEMNQLARNYYLTKDPKYAAVFGPEGPLNYRVFSSPSYTDEQVCPHIEESLKILDVSCIQYILQAEVDFNPFVGQTYGRWTYQYRRRSIFTMWREILCH
jgi:hypothetical protein